MLCSATQPAGERDNSNACSSEEQCIIPPSWHIPDDEGYGDCQQEQVEGRLKESP
jgi:hypothetical protein